MAVGLVGPPHGSDAWRFAKDDETGHERHHVMSDRISIIVLV